MTHAETVEALNALASARSRFLDHPDVDALLVEVNALEAKLGLRLTRFPRKGRRRVDNESGRAYRYNSREDHGTCADRSTKGKPAVGQGPERESERAPGHAGRGHGLRARENKKMHR